MSQSVIPAVATFWKVLHEWGAALKANPSGNGTSRDCEAAFAEFEKAYAAVLAFRPTTMNEVAAYARATLNIAGAMAADGYLTDGLEALARLDRN